MDFSRMDHRLQASCWFIDQTRERFARKAYANLELLGFYILPEELPLSWRSAYKQYDSLIPQIARYLHACNEGLFWIPYNMAPGYSDWQSFGIDMAYLQPNYYWDTPSSQTQHPLAATFSAINRLKRGD